MKPLADLIEECLGCANDTGETFVGTTQDPLQRRQNYCRKITFDDSVQMQAAYGSRQICPFQGETIVGVPVGETKHQSISYYGCMKFKE